MSDKFRLVTRSDFDRLVCACILKHLGIHDEILFVHPKDMQDGKIAVTARDITTNVPYVPGVHLAFDHHLSETLRVGDKPANHIIDPKAESAARVVYDHYGGKAKLGGAIRDDMITTSLSHGACGARGTGRFASACRWRNATTTSFAVFSVRVSLARRSSGANFRMGV